MRRHCSIVQLARAKRQQLRERVEFTSLQMVSAAQSASTALSIAESTTAAQLGVLHLATCELTHCMHSLHLVCTDQRLALDRT